MDGLGGIIARSVVVGVDMSRQRDQRGVILTWGRPVEKPTVATSRSRSIDGWEKLWNRRV